MTPLVKSCFHCAFFGFMLVFVSYTAHAQSLQDIQNVRVDNLSDAQIEQLIKRAESSGLNEQQLESMARERGMPASEVAKLRQRIQALRTGRRDTGFSQGGNTQGRQIQGAERQDIFDSLRRSDPYYDLSPKQ